MLAQLEDELARSRKREAFWISVVAHILFVLLIIFLPDLLPHWAMPHLLRPTDLSTSNAPTFLTLPRDKQTPPPKSHSQRLSDKNRVAQTTRPRIDRKTLDKLHESELAGKPIPPGPPTPTAREPGSLLSKLGVPPVLRQPPAPAPSQPKAENRAWPREQPVAPVPNPPAENPFRSPGSAGAVIAEASRSTLPRASGGGGSAYGMGPVDRNATVGPFDILSDTQGVDFGPYLSRVLESIKSNWYNLVPDEARPPLLKHGKVSIRFLITPSGKVAGMFIDHPSGDPPLDRAAYGGITASDPFSPLPREFHGPYLALRITFFYNPRVGEMEQEDQQQKQP
jgi:TonB family protein